MKNTLRLVLRVTPEQAQRLEALQAAFAAVCNALAPRVQETRCWNRVTLHHLTYRDLREQFPQLGSQMTCNAIYSVCKAARAVFQDPRSPFNVQRRPGKPLPLIRFSEGSPVYFDRHTLSMRGDELSIYTLDGRMRFRMPEAGEARAAFEDRKLREVALARGAEGRFELRMQFDDKGPDNRQVSRKQVEGKQEKARALPVRRAAAAHDEQAQASIPDYVQVEAA